MECMVSERGVLTVDIGSALKFGKKQEETAEDRALRIERAREIHQEGIVVDGHLGTLFDVFYGSRQFDAETQVGHADLGRLKRAGVKCAVLSAFPGDRLWPIRGVRAGLEYLDAFNSLGSIQGVKPVFRSGDVDEAEKDGKLSLILAFEGGEFLEGSLETLRMFYRLGVRILGLTWNERNALADGAAEGNTKGGLTHFGQEVLAEAGALGVLIDAAHLSEAGFWDVAERSEHPFVVSHANCHSLYGHPRNLTDGQLLAIRDTGGLIGIALNPAYMATTAAEVTVSTVCDHIEHVIDVAGEKHVALGTDLDSFDGPPPGGMAGIQDLYLITLELLKRGFPGKTISNVLGGNWMRVFRAVLG